MIELIRRASGETICVETQVAPGLWYTHIDPAQFKSALLNLVLNARDAMPHGGTLSIRMSNAVLDAREAAALDLVPGEYVRVQVADTGIGMRPEVLSRVFEPFFTTKEVGKGSGLGLAQVHGFARQSDGCASVHSTPGQGTVVSLLFPRDLSVAAETITCEPAEARSIEGPKATVLLVEDEPDVLDVMELALVDAGHQVVPARDGAEALAALRSDTSVDVLVSDVVLPGGLNGVELARAARWLRPKLPVLLASGYAAEVLAQHGADGEFELLAKPFRAAELLQHIANVMRGSHHQVRAMGLSETAGSR